MEAQAATDDIKARLGHMLQALEGHTLCQDWGHKILAWIASPIL